MLFRSGVWRPSLVRAGLLGRVEELGEDRWRAPWPHAEGMEWSAELTTYRDAVRHAADQAHGGLRFDDLRHSYDGYRGTRTDVLHRQGCHIDEDDTV